MRTSSRTQRTRARIPRLRDPERSGSRRPPRGRRRSKDRLAFSMHDLRPHWFWLPRRSAPVATHPLVATATRSRNEPESAEGNPTRATEPGHRGRGIHPVREDWPTRSEPSRSVRIGRTGPNPPRPGWVCGVDANARASTATADASAAAVGRPSSALHRFPKFPPTEPRVRRVHPTLNAPRVGVVGGRQRVSLARVPDEGGTESAPATLDERFERTATTEPVLRNDSMRSALEPPNPLPLY